MARGKPKTNGGQALGIFVFLPYLKISHPLDQIKMPSLPVNHFCNRNFDDFSQNFVFPRSPKATRVVFAQILFEQCSIAFGKSAKILSY